MTIKYSSNSWEDMKKEGNKQVAYLNANISIITLSVKPNSLNSPIKKQRLAD